MRAVTMLALLTLGASLPARADADVYEPPAVPGTVAVYRGGTGDPPSALTVHRGSAVRPAYLAPSAGSAAEAVGGRNLWLVDRSQGELVSCRALNTTVIGQRRIGCTAGRLPD